jgi:hypothetical protein
MTEQGRKVQVTRRQLLVAGGAAAGAAAVGVSGSYILGDGFEEHVADVLGIPLELARQLTEGARDRLDGFDFEARAAAFIGATTFPGSEILPAGVRKRAVRSLVGPMFVGPTDNIGYLGFLPSDRLGAPCSGLVHQ